MTEETQPIKALRRAKELFDYALPKFDWGKSFLDAKAIGLLNEVPREVDAAIAADASQFTVLLLRPDYIAEPYGQDTYLTTVSAPNALEACRLAQQEVAGDDGDVLAAWGYHVLFCTPGGAL